MVRSARNARGSRWPGGVGKGVHGRDPQQKRRGKETAPLPDQENRAFVVTACRQAHSRQRLGSTTGANRLPGPGPVADTEDDWEQEG